jgi:hypothetical protein
MAKAIFPVHKLGRGAGEAGASGVCQERIIDRFLRALGPGKPPEGAQS